MSHTTKELNPTRTTNETPAVPPRRTGRARRTAAILALGGVMGAGLTGCATLVDGQAEPMRAASTSTAPGPNAQAMPHISSPNNVQINGQPELVTPDLCGSFMLGIVQRDANVPPDYKQKITCVRKSFPGAITSATYTMPTYTPTPDNLELTHLKEVTIAFYRDGSDEGAGSIFQNFMDENNAVSSSIINPQGDRMPCAELRQDEFYTDMCNIGRGQGSHAVGRLDMLAMGLTTPNDPQAMGELRNFEGYITGNAVNIGTQ